MTLEVELPPTTPVKDGSELDPKNVVKNRELLYRLIISQLYYDGHQTIAAGLSSAVHADPPCPPSDRLLHVMLVGLQNEPDVREKQNSGAGEHLLGAADLEFESDASSLAPEPALYETAYVTSHKQACRAGAFSSDGQLVATGSVDASIKILDVERMLAKSAPDEIDPGRETQGHPVIRTLYDHTDEVTCLDFHPKEQILVSGSKDNTIKLFDITKASVKKAYRTITDAESVRCVSFHPLGNHIITSTTHPVIRLYDVTTGQCFVCPIPSHQHTKTVNCLKWSLNGKLFASAGSDGHIKLWDGVSNRCINTFTAAHDGAEISSVCFTRNSKYLLSSGKDSMIKLWELTTSRCLIAYTGAGTTGKQDHLAQAVFNHTEDFVIFPDEATTSLCAWNSRNASRAQLMNLGHNGPVRYIIHSTTAPAFLTCSDDYRARFWYRRSATH
ncbi:cleavage stimulation factor subunit 1 Cst50 isoform X2 [Arctopsyche grandis]|uniref:cleavage stimulation factor subunit 1 Cst50 isoform X2 n=1 Tax=Arctopsyche grandis TaxID=121162 RepID=UPI00406D877B